MFRRFLVATLLGFVAAAQAEAPSATWDFLQSVGGIAIGVPERVGDGWQLPVSCDLTGLRAITTDPSILNSDTVVHSLALVAEDRDLLLSVLLKTSDYATDAARCPAVALPVLEPGPYRVFYDDGSERHLLGEIEL